MKLRPALPDLLYPPKCPFCGRILERGEDRMCVLCRRDLPWTDGPGPAVEGCDLCLSPLHYRDGVRRAVHRYKFKGVAGLAGLYGELMARCLRDCRDGADGLATWAPLHPKRKKRRGYDQAELLALRVAELRGAPRHGSAGATGPNPSPPRPGQGRPPRAGRAGTARTSHPRPAP